MRPSLGLLLLLLCALVTGCGGNDDGRNGESSTATAPATTPSATTDTPTVESAPSKSGGSTPESRQVERYLRDNFGGTGSGAKAEWYGHVVEVSVSGSATTVRTDLSAGRVGRTQARQICESVRGAIPGLTDEVRVTGLAAGRALANCVP